MDKIILFGAHLSYRDNHSRKLRVTFTKHSQSTVRRLSRAAIVVHLQVKSGDICIRHRDYVMVAGAVCSLARAFHGAVSILVTKNSELAAACIE